MWPFGWRWKFVLKRGARASEGVQYLTHVELSTTLLSWSWVVSRFWGTPESQELEAFLNLRPTASICLCDGGFYSCLSVGSFPCLLPPLPLYFQQGRSASTTNRTRMVFQWCVFLFGYCLWQTWYRVIQGFLETIGVGGKFPEDHLGERAWGVNRLVYLKAFSCYRGEITTLHTTPNYSQSTKW